MAIRDVFNRNSVPVRMAFSALGMAIAYVDIPMAEASEGIAKAVLYGVGGSAFVIGCALGGLAIADIWNSIRDKRNQSHEQVAFPERSVAPVPYGDKKGAAITFELERTATRRDDRIADAAGALLLTAVSTQADPQSAYLVGGLCMAFAIVKTGLAARDHNRVVGLQRQRLQELRRK